MQDLLFKEYLKFVDRVIQDGIERDPDDLYDFIQDFIIPFAEEYGIELTPGIIAFIKSVESE